jgi:hypothetical protein
MKISVRVFIRTKTISSSLNLFRFTKIYCIQDVAKQFMAAKLLVFARGLQILPSVETLLGRNKILCQFSWTLIYVYWDWLEIYTPFISK